MRRYRVVGGRHDGQFVHVNDDRTPPRQVILVPDEAAETETTRRQNTYDRLSWGTRNTKVHWYAPAGTEMQLSLERLLRFYQPGIEPTKAEIL